MEVFGFGAGLEVHEEGGFRVLVGFSFFVGFWRGFRGVHGCLLGGFGGGLNKNPNRKMKVDTTVYSLTLKFIYIGLDWASSTLCIPYPYEKDLGHITLTGTGNSLILSFLLLSYITISRED